jgi:hypothetical protein
MDNKLLIELIAQSAKLEENVAKLYLLFSKLFTEDEAFWLQLHSEELNHKAIFDRFLQGDLPYSLFPEEIVDTSIANLRECNSAIETEMEHFLSKHKKRLEAYRFAVTLEERAGEMHFQQAMEMNSDSESLFLLQRINKDDMDHKKRIEQLIAGIQAKIKKPDLRS